MRVRDKIKIIILPFIFSNGNSFYKQSSEWSEGYGLRQSGSGKLTLPLSV